MRRLHTILFPGMPALLGLLFGVTTSWGVDRVSYELPPPPPMSPPPAIDLERLEIAAEQRAAPDGKADQQIAALEDEQLRRMLENVSQAASRRTTLETMLFEQLRRQLPGESADYILERAILPEQLELPKSGWSVEYEFRMPSQGIGTVTFTGLIRTDGGRRGPRFSGSIHIDRHAQGLQVNRLIHRGEQIEEESLTIAHTRLSDLVRGALTDPEQATDTIARRELRPGQWLTAAMIEQPDVIKQGQALNMCLERGPIRITTTGVARRSGSLGEIIPVENLDSGRRVFSRVISKDAVKVIF